MATMTQRAVAIAEALLNRTATLTEIDRVARAFARDRMNPEEYDALNNAQKAEVLVRHFRHVAISAVQHAEAEVAAQSASLAVRDAVNNDFEEQP